MLATLLLVFREVLEAALIVSIVAAATRGVPRRGAWIGAGLGLGVLGAGLVALSADVLAEAMSGMGQEWFNAGVLLAAVAMIGWHVVWMARHGRELAVQMNAVGSAVQQGHRPLAALLAVVAIAVLREGSEIVLFGYGLLAGGSSSAALISGGALGLVAGVAVGASLYAGLVRIPMRHFFSATNGLLVLLAAGLASSAAGYLVQADALPALVDPLWDTSALLDDGSLFGQTLHVLVGYSARPVGMQALFYAAVVCALLLGMRLVRTAPPSPSPVNAASPHSV